jgi:hypothetical protein
MFYVRCTHKDETRIAETTSAAKQKELRPVICSTKGTGIVRLP